MNKAFKIEKLELDLYVVAKCESQNSWKDISSYMMTNWGQISLNKELAEMYMLALNGDSVARARIKNIIQTLSRKTRNNKDIFCKNGR